MSPEALMQNETLILDELKPECSAFYHHALTTLKDGGVPFLLGGAYALHQYTGIVRHTKDLDVFVRPTDCMAAMDRLAAAGYRTELRDPVWLAKAYSGEFYVDLIFGSGKAVAQVDDDWFAHATAGEVLSLPVQFIPVEEMIWSKAFVMERERYDGADIAHLLYGCAAELDWKRLLDRFGPHWRVLYTYLILFGFIYPARQDRVPAWVMAELANRLRREGETPPAPDGVCYGTVLSAQFQVDIAEWGYQDARLIQRSGRPSNSAPGVARGPVRPL
jgi:hypothetical protein